MKRHAVYIAVGTVVVGVFFGGYWLGGEMLPKAEKEAVMPISHIAPPAPSEKSSHRIQSDNNKEKDADFYEPQTDLAIKNNESASFLSQKQTQEELAASVRASGVPEEDVEAVAQTLAGLTTGVDSEIMSAPPELTASQLEDVRASGVPEEDVEDVAQTLGATVDEEFADERAISYEEAAAAARASGVPEEDVEAVAETVAAPELQNSVPDQAEQIEKKAEAVAIARDAGVPEEDVEMVAETLVGISSGFSSEEDASDE